MLLVMIILIAIFACVAKRRTPKNSQPYASMYTNMRGHPSLITDTTMDGHIQLSPIIQKPNRDLTSITDISNQIDSHGGGVVASIKEGAIPSAEDIKQFC